MDCGRRNLLHCHQRNTFLFIYQGLWPLEKDIEGTEIGAHRTTGIEGKFKMVNFKGKWDYLGA